ncbi:hypothetical protein I551_8804 [Mycobacterium ulcerans str. Harvey]|uniref:Uncharacterized protein n=1 Tax=Mycobacterium ulcerans str. Harvey TaxID=1299332 RepID=A0ABN0R9S6_MYCUL|nr:hypothetical protein I551_8804 [Mycobacterium ulcerans str. Harvey]
MLIALRQVETAGSIPTSMSPDRVRKSCTASAGDRDASDRVSVVGVAVATAYRPAVHPGCNGCDHHNVT